MTMEYLLERMDEMLPAPKSVVLKKTGGYCRYFVRYDFLPCLLGQPREEFINCFQYAQTAFLNSALLFNLNIDSDWSVRGISYIYDRPPESLLNSHPAPNVIEDTHELVLILSRRWSRACGDLLLKKWAIELAAASPQSVSADALLKAAFVETPPEFEFRGAQILWLPEKPQKAIPGRLIYELEKSTNCQMPLKLTQKALLFGGAVISNKELDESCFSVYESYYFAANTGACIFDRSDVWLDYDDGPLDFTRDDEYYELNKEIDWSKLDEEGDPLYSNSYEELYEDVPEEEPHYEEYDPKEEFCKEELENYLYEDDEKNDSCEDDLEDNTCEEESENTLFEGDSEQECDEDDSEQECDEDDSDEKQYE